MNNLKFDPLKTRNLLMGTITNNEDPDKMPHDATFHQGLHFLLGQANLQRKKYNFFLEIRTCEWERSGSVVECLTLDRGAAGSSLTGVCVLCPRARHINPSLVLVQLRKTRPYITERLLMGCKESNQQN